MKDYVIFTDSCADLDEKMLQELEVQYLPFSFTSNDSTYRNWADGRELSFKDFYDKLRAGGSASTSQVNATEFVEAFRPILQSGKDLVYLAFSSGLSGTIHSARLAADDLAEEFPDAKVLVVDTYAASLGQGLLVWHTAQLKKQGKTMQEVATWVEENQGKLAHWFTVDDLNFLKRGGRLSGAAALFGTMLNIKPVLHVDDEGHLIAMEKVRGRKQSLNALVDHMEKTATNPAQQLVFISHADAPEDAQYVAEEVKRRLGVTQTYINYIGPVIGSHAGPGTVALFFLASER